MRREVTKQRCCWDLDSGCVLRCDLLTQWHIVLIYWQMQTQKERAIENKLASTSFWQLLMLAAALVIWAAAITGLLSREQTAARGWHFRMIKMSNLSNQAVTFSTDLPFLPLNCLSHDGSCSSSREGGGEAMFITIQPFNRFSCIWCWGEGGELLFALFFVPG